MVPISSRGWLSAAAITSSLTHWSSCGFTLQYYQWPRRLPSFMSRAPPPAILYTDVISCPDVSAKTASTRRGVVSVGAESTPSKGLSFVRSLSIPSAEAMEQLGSSIGVNAERGDTILLIGNLGAGKTCFTRGFIRACLSNQEEIVTSPTYLLDNTYNGFDSTTQKPLTIHHMDLYRLNGPDDVYILGIPSIFMNSVCLVEWPCRLGNEFTPKERLEVCINMSDEDGSSRTVELRAYGEWWRESVEMASCSATLEEHLNGSPPPGMRPGSRNLLPPWPSMTNLAHVLWNGIVQPGDTCIDFTCGTGRDSVALSKLVGHTGHLICVDIQERAIKLTKGRLDNEVGEAGCHVDFVKESFVDMPPNVEPGNVKLIVYNLGDEELNLTIRYLPGGGDKTLFTKAEDTVESLSAALNLLCHCGVLSVMLYPGHEEGKRGAEMVKAWARKLAEGKTGVRVMQHELLDKPKAPILLTILNTTTSVAAVPSMDLME